MLFDYFFMFCIFLCFAQNGILSDIINETGCLSAGEKWLESNLLVVAGAAVGIAFLQVCKDKILFFTSFKFIYNFTKLEILVYFKFSREKL